MFDPYDKSDKEKAQYIFDHLDPQPTAPAPLTAREWHLHNVPKYVPDSAKGVYDFADEFAAARCQPLLERIKILEDALGIKKGE